MNRTIAPASNYGPPNSARSLENGERAPLLANGDAHGGRGSPFGGPRAAPPSGFDAPYKPTNVVVDSQQSRRKSMIAKTNDQEPLESPEEIEAREVNIELLEEREADRRTRLEEINLLWGTKRDELEAEIEEIVSQLTIEKEELNAVVNPPEPPPPRPGPPALAFIDGSTFMGICTTVIVVNLAMMIYELQHPSYADKWWTIDQVFMAFYVVELTLKCVYMQREAFIGPVSIVWWNWLDAVIVVSGVLDQWVQPLLMSAGVLSEEKEGGGGMGPAQMLRMLRLARLARILKIVRVFLQSDLTWTEGVAFQTFIMGVIGINSLLMGFETDIPDFAGWYYIEQILLVIYSFELAVRMKKWGGQFFCNQDWFWNYMDFIIVVGGQIDQWMLPSIVIVQTLVTGKKAKPIQLGQAMVLLRMARLLRILRLVRLIKNIPPLFNLIVGIIQAMQGMIYVLILTVVLLYAFAILAVRLVGEGMIFGGECPDEVKGIFDNVLDSMFVLFKVMNGDQGTLGPLLHMMPIMKLIFAIFMITTSWAILSILTAVVSENMIAVTEKTREEREEAAAKEDEKRTKAKLTEIFQQLDTSGDKKVDEREFGMVLKDRNAALELCDAARCRRYDLQDLFDILSVKDGEHGGRVILYEDFISGLGKEKEAVTYRSIMKLERRMRDLYMSQRDMRESMQWMIDQMPKKKKDAPPSLGPPEWPSKPEIDGMYIPPTEEEEEAKSPRK